MGRSNNKHIAYIISMKNGMNRFIYREVNELIESGLNITLFPTKYASGPYMPKSKWNMYKYNTLNLISGLFFNFSKYPRKSAILLTEAFRTRSLIDLIIAFDFSYYMKKNGITKIHCHFADHKLFIGYFCKRILQVPLSVTVHAYELYNNPNPTMFKKSLEYCDKIVAISEYNKLILTSKLDVNNSKISVIKLFVEPRDLEKRKVNILIVGRYVAKKGHDVLFKAIKLLGRNDISVWVAGIGDDSNLKSLAENLKISDKIVFFGTVSDEVLDVLYTQCDIFCLPSREDQDGDKEGIPVALMEAMSYGKPVISTRHAGIPELVKNILVEENNIEELAHAISDLADKPDLRTAQGKENREIIRTFSEDNLIKIKEIMRE